jgi:hypothetical protein
MMRQEMEEPHGKPYVNTIELIYSLQLKVIKAMNKKKGGFAAERHTNGCY